VTPPKHLYRYRPLDDALVDRELNALKDAFLWSPHFAEMNDPMEAFYELGGIADPVIDRLLASTGKSTSDMYEMARQVIDNFCLVSFSSDHMNLPMWAYYASNFAGMCLEFSTEKIFVGDFQNERLLPVTYAEAPLPPIAFHELDAIQPAIESRLSRKRREWQHEKEWRILTGAGGARYYVDDALTRIFLGARMTDANAERICALFKDRPTEILRGRVDGYKLTFEVVKPVTAFADCERVGEGKLDLDELIYDREELAAFLRVPFERLTDELSAIAALPNTQAVSGCDIAGSHDKNAIYVWSEQKLRSDRIAWHKIYFDRHMKPVA
jgi:hypothetical protein